MVIVEPPKVSGIQPIGVPGDAVWAYLSMPPYLEAAVADGVGVAEAVAAVVVAGLVTAGVVVVGVVRAGVVTAGVVAVGETAGVVDVVEELQPAMIKTIVSKTATGTNNFFIPTSFQSLLVIANTLPPRYRCRRWELAMTSGLYFTYLTRPYAYPRR